LFAISATCSYAQWLLGQGKPADEILSIANYFLPVGAHENRSSFRRHRAQCRLNAVSISCRICSPESTSCCARALCNSILTVEAALP
jgi:hypothetical protein